MESNDTKRPNAALINREWFESAAGVLGDVQLMHVLTYAVRYVLYGEEPTTSDNSVRVVFAMIRPALDSDIAKYRERCERNADNARRGSQRVAASGTQSQRVGANTTTTTTSTTTTTTSLSAVEVKPEEIEREKWLIYGYFWSTGSKAVLQECNAFWSYYESLGWKNNKGAAIVSKLAAARMWRRQFETGDSPNGAAAWFNAVKECPVNDYNAWHIYAGAEKTDTGALIRLRCNETFLADLMKALPTLKKSLQGALRAVDIDFECIGG